MIKALFFDIDGTLVSFRTHRIPQSAISALRAAKNAGLKIFISTGRPKKLINNLFEVDDLIDGYVTTNGAYCFVGNTDILYTPMEESDVRIIMDCVDKYGVACIVVGKYDVRIHNATAQFKEMARMLAVDDIKMDTSLDVLLRQGVVQMTPFFNREQELQAVAGTRNCISSRWFPDFTDITADGADKGKGIEAVARHFGIDVTETMAFGDGGNDVTMLAAAGIGVAMGNASDDVKRSADYVTASVDDDGIASALRHFKII